MFAGSIILMTSLVLSVGTDRTINREIYTNFRGNAQHDGYLRFGDSTFKYPLKQIWNNTQIQCQFVNPKSIPVFANNTYYCVSGGTSSPYQEDFSKISSINPINGKIIWTTNLNQQSAKWAGPQYTINGYLSVYQQENYQIYILNGNNGNIVQNIQLPRGAVVGITSYNNLFYVFYETTITSHGGLLSIDPEKGIIKLKNLTVSYDGSNIPFPPTLCLNGEIIILYDLYNISTAYNTTTFDIIWSNKVTKEPLAKLPICIEPNRILYMFDGFSKVQVVDATNGNILADLEWYNNRLAPPAVHVDKQILIIDDGQEYVVAVNISDSDPNNWNNLWKVDGNAFNDVIIVDDSIILTNDYQEIVVLDINNGTELWKYWFDGSAPFSYLHVTPGIDINGESILITIHQNPNNLTSFILGAFL